MIAEHRLTAENDFGHIPIVVLLVVQIPVAAQLVVLVMHDFTLCVGGAGAVVDGVVGVAFVLAGRIGGARQARGAVITIAVLAVFGGFGLDVAAIEFLYSSAPSFFLV